jgi:hypothetical protein
MTSAHAGLAGASPDAPRPSVLQTSKMKNMHSLDKSIMLETDSPATDREVNTHSVSSGDVTICCYDAMVPPFIEAELDRLYQHVNSSLSHYAVRRKAMKASSYVASRAGKAIAILLFRREKRKVSVINEMIDIAPEELERFATYIFGCYPSVAAISFSLIGRDVGRLALPYQQYDTSEDIVLTLPASGDAYLESLSAKTRRNIRRYLRAIARDNPTFRFEAYARGDIKEQHLYDLIELKKRNIDEKNLKFGIANDDLDWIVQQARLTGLVTVALIDGKVCGGSISMQVEDHYFGQVIAYDPTYQKYSLGILCCYQAICDQIARGAKESHLCWGRYQYKYKLNGVLRERASLDIYRSRAAYLRNAGVVLTKSLRTYFQESKKRLLDMEHEEGAESRLGPRLVRTLRKIKRFRWGK